MKKTIFTMLILIFCLVPTLLISCNSTCNHAWDDGTTTRAATCLTEGEQTLKCTLCGATATKAIPKGAHTFTDPTVTEPTCIEDGKTVGTCSVCQQSVVEILPATGEHRWGAPQTIKSATCGEDGILMFTCLDCKTATREETIPATGNHAYTTGDGSAIVKVIPTAQSDGIKVNLCRSCVAEKESVYTYAEYQSDLSAARSALSAVDVSRFGTKSPTKMSTTRYDDPDAYPKKGAHPRILFNKGDIATLRSAMRDNENISTIQDIIKIAGNYDSGMLGEVKNRETTTSEGPRGENNLNENILRCLMAKAFLYQMTGAKTYAYDSIRMIKEYMATMQIKTAYPDPERNWGYAMFTAAIVYDWCYDAMSAQDKTDIIRGVEFVVCAGDNMEVGFPPSGQGAFSGHGAERQILRDYLSFAIAIYDEEPTWYEFIGGRFYEQYVPARNSYYEAHMVPQGISTYIQIRYSSDLWSAWIMKSATGSVPYNADDMKEVMTSIFCRVTAGGAYIFPEGDDELKTTEQILQSEAFSALISAYLFNDTVSASWAKHLGYAHTDAPLLLILRSTKVDESLDHFEQLPLIRYQGGFLGEIIAHTDHTKNAASVLMKIGNRNPGGHDHADAGSFQIYYGGILAGDTGVYDSFNTSHHKNYHRATIAHNTIIIYRDGKSYGQRTNNEPNMEAWKNGTCDTGVTTGYAYGYRDAEQAEPVFAYIAGDISKSYSGNLERADRRMLAVFDTGNPDIPMYFFVYDNTTSLYATDTKVFLLHTKTNPQINGNTVTATSGSGKLVLQNVVGGANIEKIGGTNNNFVVNGSQIPTDDGSTDGYWGRVEISSATGSKNSSMLNVMYVTNFKSNANETAVQIKNRTVVGSVIGNTAAIFVESADRISSEFYFNATGSGELNYYVSGVAAGKWNVIVGNTIIEAVATEEGGLLTFTAPAGMVTITPAN